MTNSKKYLIGIIAVVIIAVIALASSYNGLVSLSEKVDSDYAIIQTDIQRRADLLPNLISTVKQYAKHEEEIFTKISEDRAKLLSAKTPNELSLADKNINEGIGRLLAISESYPELKSNENFLNLQDELAGTENRIAVSRKDYNDTVKQYNTKIKSFPTVLMAGMFGFNEKEYFESTVSNEVPKLDFE